MLFFIVGNEIFYFFKKMTLCFFGRGCISKRGQPSSPKFWGELLKRGGGHLADLESDRFRIFFSWVGERGREPRQNEMRSIFQNRADTLEDTMMDFWKVIYENVKKEKHSFHNKRIYIYRLQTFWSFMKFYFVNIAKVCCL